MTQANQGSEMEGEQGNIPLEPGTTFLCVMLVSPDVQDEELGQLVQLPQFMNYPIPSGGADIGDGRIFIVYKGIVQGRQEIEFMVNPIVAGSLKNHVPKIASMHRPTDASTNPEIKVNTLLRHAKKEDLKREEKRIENLFREEQAIKREHDSLVQSSAPVFEDAVEVTELPDKNIRIELTIR